MAKPELSKDLKESIDRMMLNFVNQATVPSAEIEDSITLSASQQVIVESTKNNILVVAGAGSGKTRVLTERVKYLIEERKVDPSNIVCITFTNMASEEMKARLQGVEGIGDAFIGTIHSFANRIYNNSGYTYKIFSEEIDISYHKTLIDRYCTDLTLKAYLRYKELQELCLQGRVDESEVKEFLSVTQRYELRCIDSKKPVDNEYPLTVPMMLKQNNVITFDELLAYATEYFESLGSRLEYLLVDEFQDIGSLEYNFIRSLNSENYFFVGDDWQSIYGFKGGNVSIFKGLVNSDKFTTYYLSDNYRNSKEVFKFSQRIIGQLRNVVKKDCKSLSKSKGEVTVGRKFQLNNYLSQIKKEGKYGDWFILARSNKDLYSISITLDQMGIPYSQFKKSDMTLAEMKLQMALDTVKLITIHTAKGLESKNVLMWGNFPVSQPAYLRNEEERKVMYVGVTRAEEKLILLN